MGNDWPLISFAYRLLKYYRMGTDFGTLHTLWLGILSMASRESKRMRLASERIVKQESPSESNLKTIKYNSSHEEHCRVFRLPH